jgi:acyl-CoA synthetase (AMP-forming)/AMP-acid ligase II
MTRSERYNASSVLDRSVEEGRGGKPAVIAADRTLSYAELLAEANRMGHLLRSLGVHRKSRVLMVLDDTTAFPVTFLGAMRIGAIPVPVSVLDKDDNFRHFVDDSYADVVVADAAVMPRLRAALEGARSPSCRPAGRLLRRLLGASDPLTAKTAGQGRSHGQRARGRVVQSPRRLGAQQGQRGLSGDTGLDRSVAPRRSDTEP